MKKQPQYPLLPRYICRQTPNGRFKNTKTGEWLSDRELEIYAVTEVTKENRQEVKQPSVELWHNKYDNY